MDQRITMLGALFALAACTSKGNDSTGGGTDDSSGGTDDSSGGTDDSGTYAPKIDPSDFSTTIDNPYFPLPVGTTFVSMENGDEEVNVTVTSDTRVVMGVTTVVVHDVLTTKDKKIGEDTYDWYAQDKDGNVWYMGEDSFEREHGRFVRAGDSWLSGVDGARPGIIMPAHPKPGDRYRQEYYPPGQALDEAHVLGERGPVTVPSGTFERVLVTSEFSPLEPQTEEKYYVAGVGEILERVVKGHHEEFRLVGYTR